MLLDNEFCEVSPNVDFPGGVFQAAWIVFLSSKVWSYGCVVAEMVSSLDALPIGPFLQS